MLIADIISEKVQETNSLFHATQVDYAARMLFMNEITARTDHMVRSGLAVRTQDRSPTSYITKPGVSLTRSRAFAAKWRDGNAILELDENRLRQRYRIITIDYYVDRREAEEFVVGTIKPLDAFLKSIWITEEVAQWCIDADEKLIPGHKDFDALLSHPKLRIGRP
jgi:hypothetical protein